MTTNGKGLNETHLPVLYNFARAISAVFDIQTLMTHFFNILKTAVDFDAGAYFVCHENHLEGRVYVKGGMDKAQTDEFTAAFSKKVTGSCRCSVEEGLRAMGLSYLMDRYDGARKSAQVHRRDLELKYMGSPAGVITIVSYAEKDPFEDTPVVEAMAEHANAVLEGLLTHMFAEEKKLADILMNMSEGVYIIDGNGVCNAVNPKGLEMVRDLCDCEGAGFEQAGAERWVFAGCDCEFTRCVKRIRESALPENGRHEEIKTARNRVFTLSISALLEKGGYIIVAKDVTEERLMQKRMMLSSKLASLGEMAAGVAHEINNPLQAILCNIELIDGETNESGHRRLKRVRDGVLRIKTIIKDLLIFAREQTTETENADLNPVIEKSLEILKHQLRMVNVSTALDLFPKPMIVKINRNMFQQVMINLLQNARDAMEESGTGSTVTIRSRLAPGKEAIVEVSDDGPGIPEKIIDRIFDPFFTTKDVGKGTGLGLSVSRKIIEGMGGSITVTSSVGKGTVFQMSIPHQGAVIDERRARKRREYDYSIIREKSILMVDDDEEVLRIVSEAVRPRVASVDPVRVSTEAFERIMEKDYDFILLDIKMPGMDGIEFFTKMADARPHLAGRVIFMTGDIESGKTAEFLRLTGCRYLAKPFAISELLDAVCEVTLKKGAVKG
ncbi:MAG: response regulator [Deltaproteobacteria bacterium]|nr:response regulator [Deltaproteobacteria bacterium]